MLVGIHQLHYLPWLRYFDKIAGCDVFIVLDNIQYNKNGWQNRNKIKSPSGPLLLTVPVIERFGQNLNDARVNNAAPWRKKHWRSITQCYAKARFFGDYADFLDATYAREWEFLNDINRHMLAYFIGKLGIETRIVYASEIAAPGVATERLVNLITAVGGDRYYSGAHALEAYLDREALARAGIRLELQEWRPPVYPQLGGDFVPDLSILDLLLNCGPESLRVLMNAVQDTAQ
jgi:hypothetical protein